MDVFAPCIGYVKGIVDEVVAASGEKALVSIGGSTVDHPNEVYICENPVSVEFTDVSTSHMGMGDTARGLYRVTFSVLVQMQAQALGAEAASKVTMGWFEAMGRAVANDKTLGNLCTHAVPYFSTGATACDGKLWTNVIECGVRIVADFNPKR